MKKTDQPQNDNLSTDQNSKKNKWLIPCIALVIVLILGVGGFFGYKAWLQNEAQKQAEISANDAVAKNDAYNLTQDTDHRHAVEGIDDKTGLDIAGLLAEVGIRTDEDIKNRPPYVELTDENTRSFATVESALITKEDVSIVEISVKADALPISDDGYYYLFSKAIYEDEIYGEPITKTEKDVDFTMHCNLNYNTSSSRLFDKFSVAVLKDGKYVQVSNDMYITNPKQRAQFATSVDGMNSKKGLLVDPVLLNSGQLTDLGVKHGAYNVYMSLILGNSTNPGYPTINYTYNGQTYHFNGEQVNMYDIVFSSLTNQGIDVNAIVINDAPNTNITYPESRGTRATLYAFNASDKAGVDLLAATCSFLANRYNGSSGHGKVSNWIIGNEVNERSIYNYMPYVNIQEYAERYADVMRVCYNAMCAVNKSTRVFISMDQRWNMNKSDDSFYDVRDVLDPFNDYVRSEGNFDWEVGFHPYNYPLTLAKAWDLGNYSKYCTNSADTAVISMKNIQVLTDYLCQDSYKTSDGKVRHVILSEMGYTSYFGQEYQAASYAYAYKIMCANQYIDYMLMSRQTDAGIEVADKLATGINTSGYAQKAIYNVFKYIGTPSEAEYVDKYLGTIGISSWSEITSSRAR